VAEGRVPGLTPIERAVVVVVVVVGALAGLTSEKARVAGLFFVADRTDPTSDADGFRLFSRQLQPPLADAAVLRRSA
jgi:hypothetical protein